MLCKRQFVILIGKPGDGKSTIARNLAKTFLNARLVDNVVIPESPQEHIQCDKGQKQLIIFEDIFKNCEAAVDLGAVFDSVLKMLNEDCYSNTYVVMTSRSNEYVCSLPDLRLLEHIKCLIEIFVVEIKTTRKEAIEIFRSYVLLCGPEHSERKFSNLEHNHQIENDFIPFSFRSIQAIIKCIADTKMMEVNEQNGIKNITDKGMFGDLVIVTRSCNLMREIFSGIPSEIMLSFLRVSENIWFGEPDYQACDSESRQLCKILMTYLSESESTTDFLLQSTQLCDESYSLTQALVTKENSTKMCLCQLELQSGLFGEFTFPKLVIAVNFLPALEIRCLYQETVSSKVSTLLNEFFPDYCLKLDFCYGILKASTGMQFTASETFLQLQEISIFQEKSFL